MMAAPFSYPQRAGGGLFAALPPVAFLLLLALSACSEEVTAVEGTGQPYTFYGVISPQLDSQWVLVYTIDDQLAPGRAEPLGARFTSTDLQGGEKRVWRDSVVQEPNGEYAHIYWSPFRAEYGHTYRLEAERADGAVSHAEVAVPARGEILPQEPQLGSGVVIWPIFISGDAPRLNRVDVEYTIDYKPLGQEPRVNIPIVFSYDGRQRRSPGGWTIPIDLRKDKGMLQDSVIKVHKRVIDSSYGVVLAGVTVRLIVSNAAWDPPGGAFDSEVLVQPELMSNVENGFGFVGAGYRLARVAMPPREAVEAAGFE